MVWSCHSIACGSPNVTRNWRTTAALVESAKWVRTDRRYGVGTDASWRTAGQRPAHLLTRTGTDSRAFADHPFVSDGWTVGATVGVCLRLLIVGRRDGRRMSLVRNVSRAGAVPARNEHDVVVRYCGSDGRFVDTSLGRLPVDGVLSGLPVREFRSYRGRRHYSGWYWSATTGGHVVYESRLELVRLLLADQDPDVVAIAAQPLLLEGLDGTSIRRHVPDVLLGYGDGAGIVVDVKAASRLARTVRVDLAGVRAAWCPIRGVVGHGLGAAGDSAVSGGLSQESVDR